MLNLIFFFAEPLNYISEAILPGPMQITKTTPKPMQKLQTLPMQTALRLFLSPWTVLRQFVPIFPRRTTVTRSSNGNRRKRVGYFPSTNPTDFASPIIHTCNILFHRGWGRLHHPYTIHILLRQQSEEPNRLVGYLLRIFENTTMGLTTTQGKWIDVIITVLLFRPYIRKNPHTVRTEYEAFMWLQSISKSLTNLSRWYSRLSW